MRSSRTPKLAVAGLALCFFVAGLPLAANDASVIPLGSPVYGLIDALFSAGGLTEPFAVRPWTVGQARALLEQARNKTDSLSREWQLLAGDAAAQLDALGKNPEPFRIDPYAGLEFFGRTNGAIESDYLYGEREPLFGFHGGIYLDNFLAIEGDFDLRQEPTTIQNQEIWSNFILDFSYYDVQFPTRAYASAAGDNWRVFFGRDKLEMGGGHSTQLIASASPHWLDRLQVLLFWPEFQYSMVLIYLEPWLRPAEEPGGSPDDYWEHTPGDTSDHQNHEPSKYLALHRFDFRPLDWLTLTITEGLMYGGKYPDLRLLNPLQIFHSFYEWEHSSSLASLEASIVPLAGLELYGQFMFNQIQSEYELSKYGADSIPNATGWMAGTQFTAAAGPGYFTATAEVIHADPYLYIRENPLLTFSWRRRTLSNTGGDKYITLPIGSKYGPDSNAVWARFEYQIPALALAGFEFEFLSRGENTITSPYDKGEEAAAARTPSGSRSNRMRFGLDGSVGLLPYQILILEAGLDLVVLYPNNVGAEVGLEAHISALFDFGKMIWMLEAGK